jgi:hypothetical protein
MSGRIGALNTAGRGCVDPLGVPSCEAMVTVGRVAIFAVGCRLRSLRLLWVGSSRLSDAVEIANHIPTSAKLSEKYSASAFCRR